MNAAFTRGPLPVCLLAAFLFLPAGKVDALSPAHRKPGPVMRVGDSWRFDGGLTVTFLEVVSDTRRYAGPGRAERPPEERPRSGRDRKVRGNAGILLRIEAGSREPETVRINTSAEPDYLVIPENVFPEGLSGIPKSYVVSIHKLLPEASKRGGLRAQRAYRLRLRVEVAL